MFVNAVSPVNGNGAVYGKKGANIKSEPTFKRENYIKVFDKQFNRSVGSFNLLVNSFKELLDACQFPKTIHNEVFTKGLKEEGLFGFLGLMRTPGKHRSSDEIANKILNKPLPIVTTTDGEPVVHIINNGTYQEENFLSRLRHGTRRNINVVFDDLAQNRVIIFGLDYDGDGFVAKGTYDYPVMRMDTVYTEGGLIKQRARYSPEDDACIVQNYHPNGEKWNEADNLFEDFKNVIRDTLRGISK